MKKNYCFDIAKRSDNDKFISEFYFNNHDFCGYCVLLENEEELFTHVYILKKLRLEDDSIFDIIPFSIKNHKAELFHKIYSTFLFHTNYELISQLEYWNVLQSKH